MAGGAETEGHSYGPLADDGEAAAVVGTTRRTRLNCVLIGGLTVGAIVFCIWYCAEAGKAITASSLDGHESDLFVICFNVTVAAAFSVVLMLTLIDTTPMTVNYKVMGRPDIIPVEHSFKHLGRFTTFTLWCNTVAVAYFTCAGAVGILEFRGHGAPNCLKGITLKLWEITFPMAFLVNLVVTFVLIPGMKKQGHFEKLYFVLTWRPQLLHNGFVLVAAIEAAIAHPPLVFLPVLLLFGTVYVVFAGILFTRIGVFHYFFMDPRFKHAPLAIAGLMLLLLILHYVGVLAIAAAAHSMVAGAALIVAALATCTWSDPAAIPPTAEGSQSHA